MKHLRRLALLVGLLLTGFAPHSDPVTRWALIVGVGDYINYEEGEPGGDLPGASRDARHMHEVLTRRWGFRDAQVRLLLDQEATHENIQAGLTEWLPSVVSPGDVVVFYYAGHGSQVWDQDGDENDGLDETICPTDVLRRSSKKDIRDDQLRDWLEAIPTSKVTVILDSCNSGTATRSASWMRTRSLARDAATDLAGEQPADVQTRSAFNTRGGAPDAEIDRAEGVLEMAAARAGEYAVEGVFEGFRDEMYVRGGAFTTTLVRNLWQVPVGMSYEDVFAMTVEAMKQQKIAQQPQLSSAPTRSGALFEYTGDPAELLVKPSAAMTTTAMPETPAPTGAPVEPEVDADVAATAAPVSNGPLPQGVVRVTALDGDSVVTLGGGRAAGVRRGAVYRVGRTWLRVRSSTGGAAVAEVADGTRGIVPTAAPAEGELRVGALAVLQGVPLATTTLRVSVPALGEEDRTALQKELADVDVELVTDPSSPAHLQLEVRDGAYQVLGVDGSMRHSVPRAEVAGVLRKELASHSIAALENPAQAFPLRLDFGGPSHTFKLGDIVDFRVTAGRDGYLTIVDLDPAGAVTVVFPNQYDSDNRVSKGEEIVVPTAAMGFQFTAAEPAGRGLVRVFVTEHPLQVAPAADPLGTADAVREALRRAAGDLPITDPGVTPVGTWATAAVSYNIEP